jgi:hypothetical protein
VTEPDAPPPLARLCAAILLSGQVLDRLGRLVDAGVDAEAMRNGGDPSRDSLTVQRWLNAARADARRRMSQMAHDDTATGLDVTPCDAMTTAQAADVLGCSMRTVQRHGDKLGRRVAGRWLLDPERVRAAAND